MVAVTLPKICHRETGLWITLWISLGLLKQACGQPVDYSVDKNSLSNHFRPKTMMTWANVGLVLVDNWQHAVRNRTVWRVARWAVA